MMRPRRTAAPRLRRIGARPALALRQSARKSAGKSAGK